MNIEHVKRIFPKFKNSIPTDRVSEFSDALYNAKDEGVPQIENTKTKNPVATFFFALFLGWIGVDKFYLGTFGDALSKTLKLFGIMLLSYIGPGVLLFYLLNPSWTFYNPATDTFYVAAIILNIVLILFSLVCNVIYCILYIRDIALAIKETKQTNFNKLSYVLKHYKN
ncbi:MAG: TM2 domain-containing protein [Clostridia bacterium]|nr:TM2 domain-containing protein [Clostridia bacterium]